MSVRWLHPTSKRATPSGDDEWLVLADNEFFELEQHQRLPSHNTDGNGSPLSAPPRFRILLSDPHQNVRFVVCTCDDLDPVMDTWGWIESSVMAQVEMFDRATLEHELELFQFLVLKLTSMQAASEEAHALENGDALPSKKKKKERKHGGGKGGRKGLKEKSSKKDKKDRSRKKDDGSISPLSRNSAASSDGNDEDLDGGCQLSPLSLRKHKIIMNNDPSTLKDRALHSMISPRNASEEAGGAHPLRMQRISRDFRSGTRFEEGTPELFHSIFGLFTDKLITHIPCRMWLRTYHRGTLYVSTGHVSFHSHREESESIAIAFKDIEELVGERGVGGADLTLRINSTMLENDCLLTHIEDFRVTYRILSWLWYYTRRQRLRTVEAAQNEESAQQRLNQRKAMEEFGGPPADDVLSHPSKPSASSSILQHASYAMSDREMEFALDNVLKAACDQCYHELLRVPCDESLLAHNECAVSIGNSFNTQPGRLFISKNFACFSSFTDFPPLQVMKRDGTSERFSTMVIPLCRVLDLDQVGARKVCVTTTSRCFVFSCPANSGAGGDPIKVLFDLWRTTWAVKNSTMDMPAARRRSVRESKERQVFFDVYLAETPADNASLWNSYFEEHGMGVDMTYTATLYELVRQGMPRNYRGVYWMIASGAKYKHLSHPTEYYQLLRENTGMKSLALEEIERPQDLIRTFPDHPFYQKDEGIDLLRRILTAYAWRNPRIGYCQSMNILAAFFALFMSEEEAFWMLTTICEDLLPDYYGVTMSGSRADQTLFEALLQVSLPHVLEHINATGLTLEMFTTPWLLCMFIGQLPNYELTLRILDIFFSEGPSIFFKVGLAIFKYYEEDIVMYSEPDELRTFLSRINPSSEPILKIAFHEYADLTQERINCMRTQFQARTVSDLHAKHFDTMPVVRKEKTRALRPNTTTNTSRPSAVPAERVPRTESTRKTRLASSSDVVSSSVFSSSKGEEEVTRPARILDAASSAASSVVSSILERTDGVSIRRTVSSIVEGKKGQSSSTSALDLANTSSGESPATPVLSRRSHSRARTRVGTLRSEFTSKWRSSRQMKISVNTNFSFDELTTMMRPENELL